MTEMPKQIGNCVGCDSPLWSDRVNPKDESVCIECFEYGEFCDLKKEVELLRQENKILKGSLSAEEKYLSNKNFSWAINELIEGRSVRRDVWSGKPGSYDMIKFVGEYVVLTKGCEKKSGLLSDHKMPPFIKSIWMEDFFTKVSLQGIVHVGWMPTVNDMVASDWGPGHPDMQKLENEILTERDK